MASIGKSLVLLLAMLIAGCATAQYVTLVPGEVEAETVISVTRPWSLFGAARTVDILDNGILIGTLANDGFLKWRRGEGRVQLDVTQGGFVMRSVRLDAQKGRTYDFVYSYDGQVRLPDEPTTIEFTSNPPGATIYAGPAPERLAELNGKTPLTISLAEGMLYFKPEYYQLSLDGYEESPVMFKDNTIGRRTVHVDLQRTTPLK